MLCNPTGRQIHRREPIQLDIEKIIEAAKDHGKILDIDSYPDRLDLKDEHLALHSFSAIHFPPKNKFNSRSNLYFHPSKKQLNPTISCVQFPPGPLNPSSKIFNKKII